MCNLTCSFFIIKMCTLTHDFAYLWSDLKCQADQFYLDLSSYWHIYFAIDVIKLLQRCFKIVVLIWLQRGTLLLDAHKNSKLVLLRAGFFFVLKTILQMKYYYDHDRLKCWIPFWLIESFKQWGGQRPKVFRCCCCCYYCERLGAHHFHLTSSFLI